MPSPFPGIDPYLEFESDWPDFHNILIAEMRNDLELKLPPSYIARAEARVEVSTPGIDPPRSYRPDVLVGRSGESRPVASQADASVEAVGVLEPLLVEVVNRDPDESTVTWVEIRALPKLDLVTVIEVLSPLNKSWQGRKAYLHKRDQLHSARINLVEFDLLLDGLPLPMKQTIPPGLFHAIVARRSKFPVAEVYRWTVRDPLPRIPIPLREPDPDIFVDLGALARRVWDLGRYESTTRYDRPLPESLPLSAEDRAWIASVVGGGRS